MVAGRKVRRAETIMRKVNQWHIQCSCQRLKESPRGDVRWRNGCFDCQERFLITPHHQLAEQSRCDSLPFHFRRDSHLPNEQHCGISWHAISRDKSNNISSTARHQTCITEIATQKQIQVGRVGIEDSRVSH